MDKELYKLQQLVAMFVSKYNYTQIILKQYHSLAKNEAWLVNFDSSNYNVIRITYVDAIDYLIDKEFVEDYLYALSQIQLFKNEIKFLDVHISKHPYDKVLEKYDYINVEDNYAQGVDLKDIFPEIYNTVHDVEDSKLEIKRLSEHLQAIIKQKEKEKPFLERYAAFFTYLIIGICTFVYLLSFFLSTKYDQNSIMLLLGADYKTLTLGCKEYYRLITHAFIHSSLLHLVANMMSLYSLGKYIEYRFGHLKFLIILFFSIICGCLTQGILTDNTICVGISAGIYGLFVAFIIDAIKNKIVTPRLILPTLMINLFINFLSTTAWIAHLGGAIAGFTMYYTYTNKKVNGIILSIVLLVALLIKYLTLNNITPIYGGTDNAYVELLNQFKFNTNDLIQRLIMCYRKYGGLS